MIQNASADHLATMDRLVVLRLLDKHFTAWLLGLGKNSCFFNKNQGLCLQYLFSNSCHITWSVQLIIFIISFIAEQTNTQLIKQMLETTHFHTVDSSDDVTAYNWL